MHRTLVFAIAALAMAALTLPTATAGSIDAGYVRQIGTYDYLVSPDYDGLAPLGDATNGTTIGLGTFDHLNGELVMLGGTIYRVPTTGVPVEVSPSTRTPFVQAVDFTPQAKERVPRGTKCADLGPIITNLASTTNGIIAVRVRGTFTALTTRSVPRQSKPYPPLSQVVAEQVEFDLGRTKATLVGFWQGPSMAGIGAPGLHLHGLTADREAGGHVLSCTVGKARLAVQTTSGVIIQNIR
jgi:acetolactate decarboxylase